MAEKKYYRSKYGQIFGVCKGFAYWRDLPLDKIRLIFIIIAVCTAVAPCLIIYGLLGCILPTSDSEIETGEDQAMRIADGKNYAGKDEFEVVNDDEEALRRKYETLKKKVEDMESEIFDKENDWDARFNKES